MHIAVAPLSVLTETEVEISMVGRGRYLDNIFIDRLWRSLKYEAMYLHEMSNGFIVRRIIGDWITFYNNIRPHSALQGRTPAEAYKLKLPAHITDKPRGLPTNPQARQTKKSVIEETLAA